MVNAHIDISQGLDGERVVLACFDLGEEELGASAHAVAVLNGAHQPDVPAVRPSIIEREVRHAHAPDD